MSKSTEDVFLKTSKSTHHTLRIVNKMKSREVHSWWSFMFLPVFLKKRKYTVQINMTMRKKAHFLLKNW